MKKHSGRIAGLLAEGFVFVTVIRFGQFQSGHCIHERAMFGFSDILTAKARITNCSTTVSRHWLDRDVEPKPHRQN